MKIRPEEIGDKSNIRELTIDVFAEAFGCGDSEAKLIDEIRYFSLGKNISLVAELEDKVIGHVLFSPVSVTKHRNIQACVLGPLSVESTHQCKGIGSALVRTGFVDCMKLGYQVVFVQGSIGYYTRFGFRRISEFRLKTVFDSDHDMVMELELGLLESLSGLVEYPEPWSMFET